MRAIIVDDERHSGEILKMLIDETISDLEVLSLEQNPVEAIENIKKSEPDLLFLDIEMPGLNGFELLKALGEMKVQVIFTTAYDEFAIHAFRVGAIDYLLKPVDKSELEEAINRARSRLQNDETTRDLSEIINTIYGKEQLQSRISISTSEGIEFIPVEDIVRCKSDSNYTEIITGERKLIVSKTLKEIEKQLEKHECFLRIHHSHLVNLNYISKYIKGSGGMLILTNGDQVNVARNKKQELLERLNIG